jgi:alpha-aminoadipate carrier protein LysW
MNKITECPVCGVEVEILEDTIQGELINCGDCGTELEVISINPAKVVEAPQEEEDWGE